MTKVFSVILLVSLLLLGIDLFRFGGHLVQYIQDSNVVKLPKDGLDFEAVLVLTGDRNRIPKAMKLLHERPSKICIISGANRMATLADLVNQQGKSAVNIHAVWKRILLESRSSSTIENATESLPLLKKHKIRRVLLVTSEYHMPRSTEIFQKSSPDIEFWPIAVPSEVSELNWIPNQTLLLGISKFIVEYWKWRLLPLYFSSAAVKS